MNGTIIFFRGLTIALRSAQTIWSETKKCLRLVATEMVPPTSTALTSATITALAIQSTRVGADHTVSSMDKLYARQDRFSDRCQIDFILTIE
jgi:hypothetical protein